LSIHEYSTVQYGAGRHRERGGRRREGERERERDQIKEIEGEDR